MVQCINYILQLIPAAASEKPPPVPVLVTNLQSYRNNHIIFHFIGLNQILFISTPVKSFCQCRRFTAVCTGTVTLLFSTNCKATVIQTSVSEDSLSAKGSGVLV